MNSPNARRSPLCPWNWDEFTNEYLDMTDPLRSAMSHNPFMKIFVAIGYYEAGHMIYIRPSAHKALKNDIAKFIQGTRSSGAQRTTSQP